MCPTDSYKSLWQSHLLRKWRDQATLLEWREKGAPFQSLGRRVLNCSKLTSNTPLVIDLPTNTRNSRIELSQIFETGWTGICYAERTDWVYSCIQYNTISFTTRHNMFVGDYSALCDHWLIIASFSLETVQSAY
jgi:hypothetical protein